MKQILNMAHQYMKTHHVDYENPEYIISVEICNVSIFF